MRVGVEGSFDAAHRLLYHTGKCHNIHGHRYRVEAVLDGELDAGHMVLDFSTFKRVLNICLVKFDHALILNAADPLVKILSSSGITIFEMKYEPTAERLARLIWSYAQDGLLRMAPEFGVTSVTDMSIRVYETPTAFAEFQSCIK